MEEKNINSKKDIEENKVVAALSYVWILCLVPLFLKKNSKFCKFHAKQGLLLFIIEVIGMVIFPIPFLGWLLFILVVIFSILGVRAALAGEFWEMPILGKYTNKLNL